LRAGQDYIARVQFHSLPDGAALPVDANDRVRQFLAYWRSKAAPGRPARRRDIDPLEIPRLLPALVLLDVEADDFRFSLVGQEIVAHYGAIKDKRFRDLMSGDQLQQHLDEHRLCVTSRSPVYSQQTERSANRESWQLYQRLIAPLSDADGAVTSIAGIMAFRRYRRVPTRRP
jgi:hypothetical protein